MFQFRLVIGVLLFCSLFLGFSHRAIMSITVGPISEEYGYTNAIKGSILAAFFAGYTCLQLAGGWLSRRIGGWGVLGASLMLTSLGVFLTPIAAASISSLIVIRVLTGLGQSALYPTTHALISHWAPIAERSMFVGLAWSGGFLGTAVSIPLSGAIIAAAGEGVAACDTPWYMGWRGVFYVWGIAGFVLSATWLILGASSPERHAWAVSSTECSLIVANREDVHGGTRSVPWFRLMTHPAVVAMTVAHTCNNWSMYFFVTWMPEFLRQQLHMDVRTVGIATISPFLSCFVVSVAVGVAADALIQRGVRVAVVRKSIHAFSQLVPACALVALGSVTDAATIIGLLTVAVGALGASSSSFGANHLDVAPRFASITLAYANTVASLSGIVAPLAVGAIINPPFNDAAHWRVSFALSAVVAVCGCALFAAFGEGEAVGEFSLVDKNQKAQISQLSALHGSVGASSQARCLEETPCLGQTDETQLDGLELGKIACTEDSAASGSVNGTG